MHLGRSKAGEKSFPFRAGSDWCELEGVSDDPFTRTPALPKAGHIRWMARNPLMTAAKTAVSSIPANRSSGASGGLCWERSKHPAPIAASWRAGHDGAGSAGFGKHPGVQGVSPRSNGGVYEGAGNAQQHLWLPDIEQASSETN